MPASTLLPRPPATAPPGPLRDEYDAIVVGGRVAGAATAMLLARAGLSVLVVARSGHGSDTLSTHALTRPAVLQLSRWGVLDAVRRAGTPRVTSVVYRYGDEVVTVPIRPVGDVDGLYAPRRTVLDRVLVDAAADAGAQVLHRAAVRELCRDDDGRVSGVVVEDGTSRAAVRGRLVVGADGARSTVARLAGAPLEYLAAGSSATVYTFVEGLRDDAYRNSFRAGPSAAGAIPTNDGAANLWVGVPMERFRREGRGDVPAFFRRILAEADPALAAEVGEQATRPGHRAFVGLPGFARRPWGPGWALVGDAAYFKDPISAHGITDALIAAELLARAVLELAEGRDERVALAGYAAARMALARAMMDAVARLASFRGDPAGAQRAQLAQNRAMRLEWDALQALGPAPGARAGQRTM